MNQMPSSPTHFRHQGIDAFRLIMAFLVVLLHSVPFTTHGSSPPLWVVWVQTLCRAAVPFFFIASGFFLSPERKAPIALIRRPVARLLPVFSFWMLTYFLYLTVYPVAAWPLNPKDLVSGGAAFHLWFLPALGIALAVVGLGVRVAGPIATGVMCVVLAILGLLSSSYHDVFGLDGEAKRGGTLIAPALVYLGYLLHQRKLSLRPFVAVTLCAASYAFVGAEEIAIMQLSEPHRLISHDFTLSTFALGGSIFLLAESLTASPFIDRAASLSQISLGIYAAHVLFLWPISRLIRADNPGMVLLTAVLVFALATLTVTTLHRIPHAGRVVS